MIVYTNLFLYPHPDRVNFSPRYYANKKLTKRSDVYSFGVVLLELVSGRKPVSTEDSGTDWNIVHWVSTHISILFHLSHDIN